MSRRRDLSADEAKLWRRVARTTKGYKPLPVELAAAAKIVCDPIDQTLAVKIAPEMPHLVLKRAKTGKAASLPIKLPAKLIKHRSPVADASGHKKVRRGKLDIDARIDLHGMRQIDAQTALAGIIARTRSLGGRCVLVITGKGRPIDPGEDYITPQAGVIRRRLPEWLHSIGVREHVAGYASAHAKDGGSGAFYVLLKSLVKTT